ncbi:tRNA (N(6)-L-threonylcarbamoyladenosine(37)-C(2))-methylthiotransferase [uncultured Methanospirillum sp.]|uniref:tRNA (N(6)-L-threonylcarbamoyladenosine(37)-C(2))- methylthiotransferase n=1 Tax=uncultured Methanospirillum sp. TaxID=262503 RepID=UPI0029C80C39|nr:tRNA (N(6)-L-threonylcarbamoyladenosine(37)-C(2))-methylthiotransferase [uncultured Methanospirillum sp.]
MGDGSKSPLSPSWVQALSGKRICILTFGCTYNEGDSDRLKNILVRVGSVFTQDPQDADVVILNTCIVIEKTERKMIKLMRELEGKEIWISGCLPAARPAVLDEFPAVRVLSPESIHTIDLDPCMTSCGPVAVVQIGSGCLGHCTYCITRLARGHIRSVPQDEILSQIRSAVLGGVVEIRLTGQDLSAYGYDLGEPSLPALLREIGKISGNFYVRLGMMNPATLLPIIHDVADALDNDHIFSFVHLPVQSGSDQVLQRMGREYSSSTYLEMVEIIRKRTPGISIATDVITGFVAESEEEFRATRNLITILKPDALNVTRYSYRPGSTASRSGELPDRIRKDRSRELVRIGYSILKEKKRELVGRSEEVIITEKLKPGTVMGRTRSYTGVVIGEDLPVGTKYLVEFTDERTHYLLGRVVRSLS